MDLRTSKGNFNVLERFMQEFYCPQKLNYTLEGVVFIIKPIDGHIRYLKLYFVSVCDEYARNRMPTGGHTTKWVWGVTSNGNMVPEERGGLFCKVQP